MSRRIDPARPHARIRVRALAGRLRADLRVLPVSDSQRSVERAEPRHLVANSGERIRGTVIRLEETLAFGLRFDFAPDTELAAMRAHARNVMFVIRSDVEAACSTRVDPVLRSAHLRRAGDLAGDLISTIGRIQQLVLEAEATLPNEAWSASLAGRLLAVAATVLPADRRRAFIEDQCGNLAQAESRREWVGYLIGVLTHMPAIGAATLAAAHRKRARRDRRRR